MSVSPHQAVWNEARELLAAAERALNAGEAAELGAVVARTDSAIALLEHLLSAAPHAAPRRLLGTAWSLRARALERLGTPTALDDAVRSLDTAIARLGEIPGDPDPNVRRDLVLVLHHAGALRQQRNVEGDLPAAIAHYDRAIDVLRGLPLETNPALRQLLGAVWSNRGVTWVTRDDPAAADEALRSFDEAIASWRALPGEVPPSQQINLAAAWMNRAHIVLRRHPAADGAAQARTAVGEALALVNAHERENPGAAEVGLKARHIACRAIGALLAVDGSAPGTARDELLTAATDAVDDGLALARHWTRRGIPMPLAFIADLFRFGAQSYLAHQPHFLAEFVLENLDPQASEDPLPWDAGLHAIAREAVARALRALERPPEHTSDASDAERRIASARDLQNAAARLTELGDAAAQSRPA